MTKNRLKILLVMQDVPLTSTFLANKFIKLSETQDVHLLVWDKDHNIRLFSDRYGQPGQRIHKGGDENSSLSSLVLNMIVLFLFRSRVRKFLLTGPGSLGRRMKTVAYYLPVFKIQPDVIHFEFGTLAKDIAVLKQLSQAKIVASFRGYDINYVGLDKPGYYQEVWNVADGLHFLGTDLKKRAMTRGYEGNKPEAIISPAIDTDFFTPSEVKKSQEKYTIVSVGRLTWKKGYDYGIRAMKLLQEKGIPFEYRIIGDGPYLQALQFTIHELGLQSQVILCGQRNAREIKQELDRANVFFHPAISEGFCNAVIEAQAMGLPVVCTNADGLKENIADGETGFIVPVWDIQAMAEKLEWFWDNPGEQIRFGQNGIRRVHQHFRLQTQIDDFVKFYNKLNKAGA